MDIKFPGGGGREGGGYCLAYMHRGIYSHEKLWSISEQSFALSSQLDNILIVQTEQVEDIDQAFSVQTGRCFELDLGLGAPGDAQAGCMKHQKIVGPVADSQCLGDGDVVLGRDGGKKGAFLRGVDDGVGVD
jgi:hypothetical protein